MTAKIHSLGDFLHSKPHKFDSIQTSDIVSWDEFNSLLSSDLIDYPRIRILTPNNPYSRSYNGFLSYSLSARGERRPRLVPGVLCKIMRDGGTIIIDDCTPFFPGVNALTKRISTTYRCHTWANLYISPRGQSGFGCHFDDHDVLAVQLYGEKRWKIYTPTYIAPNRGDKSFHFQTPKGKPLAEHTLAPRSGLYLPVGYWHEVETITDISMHVSIGMDFPRRLDALEPLSNELAKDRFFRERIDCSMATVEAQELKARLIEAIRDLDMQRLVQNLHEQRPEKRPAFNFPSF